MVSLDESLCLRRKKEDERLKTKHHKIDKETEQKQIQNKEVDYSVYETMRTNRSLLLITGTRAITQLQRKRGHMRVEKGEFGGGRATVVWGWWGCLLFLGIYARDILWDLTG